MKEERRVTIFPSLRGDKFSGNGSQFNVVKAYSVMSSSSLMLHIGRKSFESFIPDT